MHTLAFIASIEDDPNRIPAVCMEENSDAMSLEVWLAVNKRNINDENAIIQKIRHGFERIFTVLQRVVSGKC